MLCWSICWVPVVATFKCAFLRHVQGVRTLLVEAKVLGLGFVLVVQLALELDARLASLLAVELAALLACATVQTMVCLLLVAALSDVWSVWQWGQS